MLFNYSECPICGFISSDGKLSNPDMPCPNCNKPARWEDHEGSRIMFPHFEASILFKMLESFYRRAEEIRAGQMKELVSEISVLSNRNVERKIVDDIFREFQKTDMEKDKDEVSKYTEMGKVVFLYLGTEGEKALEIIFNILEKYHTASDEAKITVFIFCMFFETCLTSFLKTYLLRKGTSYEITENTVDELRSGDRQIRFFQNISGEKNLFERDFYKRVHDIKNKRNEFTHRGYLFSITQEDAEKSYKLATESIPVFAELYNKFCLKELNT